MNLSETKNLMQIVNLDDYPIFDRGSVRWSETIERIRADLTEEGCCVLVDFIRKDAIPQLLEEGRDAAPKAYKKQETVNAYNIKIDDEIPEDHPARIPFTRGNAFVAKDQISESAIIQALYSSEDFKCFVAECFDKEHVHELADPLAALCLNVLEEGRSHPWHFDTNDFTVSMLTQAPEGGGRFEYCPNIRTPQSENFDDVKQVITGEDLSKVKQLTLKPGDLQFFKGRFSLHRVSEVEGKTERHTAIFAYTETPNVVGNVERTKQLFGRLTSEHLEAEQNRKRGDALLD